MITESIRIVTCSQIATYSIRKIQTVTDSITTMQVDTDSMRMIETVTDSIRRYNLIQFRLG